jgi:hypothetical protein
MIHALLLVLAVATASAADLSALIAQYDANAQAGRGTNTMPIERAIIDQARSGSTGPLLPMLAHHRFAAITAYAISTAGPSGTPTAALVDALRATPAERQVAVAITIAGIGGPEIRAWLEGLAALPQAATPAARDTIAAARIRAGDTALAAATDARLSAATDAFAIAGDLLILGDAGSDRLWPHARRLLDDARPLPTPITSGQTGVPPARTVGDAVLVAANRCRWSRIPPETAWWLDPAAAKPAFPDRAAVRAHLAARPQAGGGPIVFQPAPVAQSATAAAPAIARKTPFWDGTWHSDLTDPWIWTFDAAARTLTRSGSGTPTERLPIAVTTDGVIVVGGAEEGRRWRPSQGPDGSLVLTGDNRGEDGKPDAFVMRFARPR